MNKEDLSPEAQHKLRELGRGTIHTSDFESSYLTMLKGLADEEIPNLADVEIKGQGMEALKRSRKDHAVAVELKAYATAFLGPDVTAEIAKLPKLASLDDFLERVMQNTGKQVRRERFMRYLLAEAESQVDEQMEQHPKPGVSREERIKQMAEWDFSLYAEEGMPAPSQYWRGQDFRKWWKSQRDSNPLTAINAEKTGKKSAKMEKMLGLLPHTKRANETMSLQTWKERAAQIYDIPERTFDRYRKELEGRFVERPKGKFRVNTNARETK